MMGRAGGARGGDEGRSGRGVVASQDRLPATGFRSLVGTGHPASTRCRSGGHATAH